MAVLGKTKRDKLPKKAFAGPGRSFPMNDKEHARKAVQLGARSLAKGNISAATYARIKARARKMGVAVSGQDEMMVHPAMMSGQDSCILGSHGRAGGHAGYGRS